MPTHRLQSDQPKSAARERVRFTSFAFNRAVTGRARAHVKLEHDGKEFIGEAEGVSTPISDLRLGADAVVRALQEFLGVRLNVEVLGVKLVRSFDADVAIVSVKMHGATEDALVGCCLAERDPVRASALAVLNATNRIVEQVISERARQRA
jgi:hypothetical protein